MRFARAIVALLLAVSLGAATAPTTQPAYPIKFHRTNKAGDVYDTEVSVEWVQTRKITRGDAAPMTDVQRIAGKLTGRVDVMETSDSGEPKTFTVKVGRFIDADGNALIPADAILSVERTENTVTFTLRDDQLSPAAKDALSHIYLHLQRGEFGSDAIAGSKIPRRVGESWPIDAAAAADAVAQNGELHPDPKTVAGTTTFKAIESRAGIPAGRFESTTKAKIVQLDGMPSNLTLNDAALTTTEASLVPLDITLPTLESSYTVEIRFVATGLENGSPLRFEGSARRTFSETNTPTKK